MGKKKWERFEREIAALLYQQKYHDIYVQESIQARRPVSEANRHFPKQAYVTAPRFDIIARTPITNRHVYVECKAYQNPVSANLVEDFAYHLWLCKIPTRRGILAVEPRLSDPAEELAATYNMTVWSGAALDWQRATGALLSGNPLRLPQAGYHGIKAGIEKILKK